VIELDGTTGPAAIFLNFVAAGFFISDAASNDFAVLK
jgi:hypothetical protein